MCDRKENEGKTKENEHRKICVGKGKKRGKERIRTLENVCREGKGRKEVRERTQENVCWVGTRRKIEQQFKR